MSPLLGWRPHRHASTCHPSLHRFLPRSHGPSSHITSPPSSSGNANSPDLHLVRPHPAPTRPAKRPPEPFPQRRARKTFLGCPLSPPLPSTPPSTALPGTRTTKWTSRRKGPNLNRRKSLGHTRSPPPSTNDPTVFYPASKIQRQKAFHPSTPVPHPCPPVSILEVALSRNRCFWWKSSPALSPRRSEKDLQGRAIPEPKKGKKPTNHQEVEGKTLGYREKRRRAPARAQGMIAMSPSTGQKDRAQKQNVLPSTRWRTPRRPLNLHAPSHTIRQSQFSFFLVWSGKGEETGEDRE